MHRTLNAIGFAICFPSLNPGAPALAGSLARQRLGRELRRIRQGLRLHQGTAHVPGELLPRLVAESALAPWLSPSTAPGQASNPSAPIGHSSRAPDPSALAGIPR